jgi:hypothetical protein
MKIKGEIRMVNLREIANEIHGLNEKLIEFFNATLPKPPEGFEQEYSFLDLTKHEWSKEPVGNDIPAWRIKIIIDKKMDIKMNIPIHHSNFYQKGDFALIAYYENDRDVAFLRLLDAKKENKY